MGKRNGKGISRVDFSSDCSCFNGIRGIKQISAMTIMAELGDITRFDSPRQLMSYLGDPRL